MPEGMFVGAVVGLEDACNVLIVVLSICLIFWPSDGIVCGVLGINSRAFVRVSIAPIITGFR